MESESKPRRYGWWIAAAVFIMLLLLFIFGQPVVNHGPVIPASHWANSIPVW